MDGNTMADHTVARTGGKALLVAKSLVISLAIVVVATLTASHVAGQAPQERDFFGTILSVQDGLLVVSTDDGIVEVPTTDETRVRLPLKRDASPADLAEGDRVALSLSEKNGVLVADVIFLIPGKTQHRHVPGHVIAVSDTEITIEPPAPGAAPITFTRNATTTVRFRAGATGLVPGVFVIVVAPRDAVTGELSLPASAIHVSPPRPAARAGREVEAEDPDAADEIKNTAKIQGVFEGVDEAGNWLVGGIAVTIGTSTDVAAGVVVGQVVEVEVEVRSDGSFLALEIEVDEGDRQLSKKTTLNGTFEGVDEEGNWIVSGTKVVVDSRTDTDGLPTVGQRVKVKALLQSDGTVLAREIEIKRGRQGGRRDGSDEVKLEGTFEGVDDDGNWIVNGIKVSVGPLTKLEGVPAVGSRLEIRAVRLKDGTVLAGRVKSKDEKGGRRTRSEAKIRGTIESILDDGTIIVDGLSVAIGDLTEIDGELKVGDYVEVKAHVQEDGSLVAREVESKGTLEAEDVPERSKVEIQGTIDRVNDDGSLVVNGVTVHFSALSETKGNLIQGASVKIEGVLQPDGSVLAREAKGEGRRATRSGNEVTVEGHVESVDRGARQRITGLVVDGLAIQVRAVTKVRGKIGPGTLVEIEAVIIDGRYIAREIRAKRPGKGPQPVSRVEISGTIEAVELDAAGRVTSVTVNGVTVEIVARTKVEGVPAVGSLIEMTVARVEGRAVAAKIEVERPQVEKPEHEKFQLQGLVESIDRGTDGSIAGLVVEGTTVTLDPLTRVRGNLGVGVRVNVIGILLGDAHVAGRIVLLRNGREDRPTAVPTEVKFEGEIAEVARNSNGRAVGIVVDGRKVSIVRVTEVRGDLVEGALVKVVAVDRNGVLTALEIEVDGGDEADKGKGESGKDDEKATERREFRGVVASFTLNELVLDDETSFVINEDTDIDGELAVGAMVKVKAVESEGVLIAHKIEVAQVQATTTTRPA